MSKPEDIPQNVWDKADSLCMVLTGDIATWHIQPECLSLVEVSDAATLRFARAILAAKAEEREAIISLAEAERIAWSRGEYFGGFNDACNTIAAAIRKRGEG